jgi:hypothetical protein
MQVNSRSNCITACEIDGLHDGARAEPAYCLPMHVVLATARWSGGTVAGGRQGGGGGLSLSTWLERTSPAAAALWFPARFVLGPARVLLGKGPVPPCVPAAKCLL